MSDYNGNNDTFLSRVFGLHSVYNQIQDNYQFYDPDIDSRFEDDPRANETESGVNNRIGSITNHALIDSESDSDLSSSSSPSSLGPLVTSGRQSDSGRSEWENASGQQYFEGQAANDSNTDDDEDSVNVGPSNLSNQTPESLDGEEGDKNNNNSARRTSAQNNFKKKISDNNKGTTRIDVSKPRPSEKKLTFNVPKVRHAKNFIYDKLRRKDRATLPLYNESQSFRKPLNGDGPSIQTIYQQRNHGRRIAIPPKERALYLWANITNMDEFLSDIYYYFRGRGLMNIVFSNLVDLFILVFILAFTVFLKWGIDYHYFIHEWSSNSKKYITLKDLIIPKFFSKRIPLSIKFLLFGFACYIILRLVQLYFDYTYKLKEIRNFYKQLIGISDDDELMTISWSTIVERLMLLKDYNSLTSTNTKLPPHYLNDLKSKVRLNAHDIANRIMRKENYMIAMINRDILDLSINPSLLPSVLGSFLTTKSVLTRTLEWNLKLCINNFVFNHQGQINSGILKEANRNHLARELSSRFKMAAIINLILCPFIVIYFLLLYFFRYFNEYKSNPSSIVGLRQYTPWAEWKLREFNELPHFFIKRLHLSIGPANTYINQFPRGFAVTNAMKLVNFVSGAFTAILVIMGLFLEDEDHSFWSFEITESKTSLFYISLFGTLWAITSNSINISPSPNSSENLNPHSSSFFYDPEASLRYVAQFTHYLPSSWNNRLHTVEVKDEFCELYSLKIIIILNELLSLILTPFILWFKVSNCSGAIVDFFRDFSIHVDGLGYICYYAMFNFEQKDKNMTIDANKRMKKRRISKDGKRTAISNDVPLTNLKSNKKDKVKHSDPESDSDDSDELENYLDDPYQDEKMVKSYMYFLESYGGANAHGRQSNDRTSNVKARNGFNKTADIFYKSNNLDPHEQASSNVKNRGNEGVLSAVDPSPSLMYQGASNSERSNFNSISDSTYNVNYGFDEQDDESTKSGKKSGVLGMLNQFYKQDIAR